MFSTNNASHAVILANVISYRMIASRRMAKDLEGYKEEDIFKPVSILSIVISSVHTTDMTMITVWNYAV